MSTRQAREHDLEQRRARCLELFGTEEPSPAQRGKLAAERRWQAPARASSPQAPCDFGLFGDERNQLDLVDQARALERAPALLILSCSELKRPIGSAFVPFGEVYDGPMWRQVRASSFPLARVAAVSALYGFLEPGQKIHTYDRKIDAKIAARFCREGDNVACLAKLVAAAGDVLMIGGQLYQELGRAAERYRPELAGRIAYGRGSYLEQRKQLGEWLRAH